MDCHRDRFPRRSRGQYPSHSHCRGRNQRRYPVLCLELPVHFPSPRHQDRFLLDRCPGQFLSRLLPNPPSPYLGQYPHLFRRASDPFPLRFHQARMLFRWACLA